jgi:transcription elongation factor Elf1
MVQVKRPLVCVQCGTDESVESEFRASMEGTVYCDICAEQIQKAIGYSGKEGYSLAKGEK